MQYTVKETARISGVTVKALHHYHKIGLLTPCMTTEAGYRIYSTRELERLQQILFYRELDFSLTEIKRLLDDAPSRLDCLVRQRELLIARRQRLGGLLSTLDKSIDVARKGEMMDTSAMFEGLNKAEWQEALSEQKEHLKQKFGQDVLDTETIDAAHMNEMAAEAQRFLRTMAGALTSGRKPDDERVQQTISLHLACLTEHGHSTDAKAFAAQQQFFVSDDFHRSMLEQMQTGLCYYLCVAAQLYAGVH